MNTQEVRSPKRKNIMIQGRHVTLCFIEHPNPKVAEQVKQALLNSVTAGKTHGKKT